MPNPALVVRNLTKTFAGTAALNSFDLTVMPGEVHALVGENGSGKSTMIKILAGYHRPDPGGEVVIDGEPLTFGSAESSYSLGCRFVHQDLGLVATASVLDNLCMNTGFPARWGTIRSRLARREAEEDLARVGLHIDPRTPAGELSPALQTGVAVARVLKQDARSPAKLLAFDEPTARLPVSEVEHLARIVRQVSSTGIAVLYVTHRLDEVFEFADQVTVLRDGRKVTTAPVSTLDRSRLIHLLVGAELDEVHASAAALHPEHGEPILKVRDLWASQQAGVSFDVHRGEIVGVAGITGSGRETLLGALFGAAERFAGTVHVGHQLLRPVRPDASMAVGVAYLSPDRKLNGGIMELSARENVSLSDLRPFWGFPWLRRRPERAEVLSWFKRLAVRPGDAVESHLSTFSGGNQQKILFSKWLRRRPEVLLLDEPTQGVDVGAKVELHRHLLAAAAEGTGVLVSSSDVDELLALSHRVLVLRDGRIVASLTGADLTVQAISHQALAADESAGEERLVASWQ